MMVSADLETQEQENYLKEIECYSKDAEPGDDRTILAFRIKKDT